jgi:hypothetical protein
VHVVSPKYPEGSIHDVDVPHLRYEETCCIDGSEGNTDDKIPVVKVGKVDMSLNLEKEVVWADCRLSTPLRSARCQPEM